MNVVSAYFIKSSDALDRMRTLFFRAYKGSFKVYAEHRRPVFSALPAFDFRQHIVVDGVGRGDQRGAEGSDTVGKDTLGHGGHPFLRPVDVMREVNAETTCPKTKATNKWAVSELVGGGTCHLSVGRWSRERWWHLCSRPAGRPKPFRRRRGALDSRCAHRVPTDRLWWGRGPAAVCSWRTAPVATASWPISANDTFQLGNLND